MGYLPYETFRVLNGRAAVSDGGENLQQYFLSQVFRFVPETCLFVGPVQKKQHVILGDLFKVIVQNGILLTIIAAGQHRLEKAFCRLKLLLYIVTKRTEGWQFFNKFLAFF